MDMKTPYGNVKRVAPLKFVFCCARLSIDSVARRGMEKAILFQ